jgi:PTS system mannitol-specific IIC component
MITYLLPILIGYTGGRAIHGQRGAVVGAIATTGVVVGSTVPMFLGAMIAGPLAAYVLKQFDRLIEDRVRTGFEMLVDNFSLGIVGGAFALLGVWGIGPVVNHVTTWAGNGVQSLVNHHLLPLASVVIEPAKVLFLNNAINHGVLDPLGIQQAHDTGKSILFLLETNPGPGLGILIAYSIFGLGIARASAPGAILIEFVGGIHEIYFPYVLMKPILVLAAIGGGMTGVAINVAFHTGLVAPASPGSIIAILIQTARGDWIGVTLSVIGAAAVSFLISAVVLRATRKRDLAAGKDDAFTSAVAQTEANKGKKSSVLGTLVNEGETDTGDAQGDGTRRLVRNIVFACDAGMGSSAMGASVLRNKFKKAGIADVKVRNEAIANLEGDADLVITQRELTDRAREKSPSSIHVSVDNFMNSPRYDEVVQLVADGLGTPERPAGVGGASSADEEREPVKR